MVMRSLVAGLTLMVVMAAGNGRAEEEFFHSRDHGSYLPQETLIDMDGDGKRADLVLVSGTSRQLGQTSTQSVLEWPRVLDRTTCPSGNPGVQGQLIGGSAVTHMVNGDLLLIWFNKGSACVDAVTNTASVSLEGIIIGGTGRFIDARGTIQINGIAIPELTFDETGLSFFSSMDYETTGMIQTHNPAQGDDRLG